MKTTLTEEELELQMTSLNNWESYIYDEANETYPKISFTCWGEKYVYFPIYYDSHSSIGFAPRFATSKIKTEKMGGG
jgi:hypothetical protein